MCRTGRIVRGAKVTISLEGDETVGTRAFEENKKASIALEIGPGRCLEPDNHCA